MGFIKRSLAGPGYIILNTIRVMNIITLLAVVAASTVMLVKTFVISKFFFFDAISHIVTACLSGMLIISELPFFRGYYARNWPLLSQSAGFGLLGLLMIIVGVSILGNLNKEATSEQSLGLSFWQIVIAAGILSCTMGVINIISTYVFRTKSVGVTARMVRAHGATAHEKVYEIQRGASIRSSPSAHTPAAHSPRRSFHLGRSDTLPSYYTSPRASARDTQRSVSTPKPSTNGLNISAPMSENPGQFAKFNGSAEVLRPDPACHPALYHSRIRGELR